MKKLLSLAVLVTLLAGKSLAQTNQWSSTGDLTFGVAPEISFPMVPNHRKSEVYGLEYQTVYWQTIHTGTGVSFGKRDFSEFSSGYIDHISATEYLRLTPWPTSPFLGRFSFEAYTGAVSWFDDGSKSVEIGGAAVCAITKSLALDVQARDELATTAGKSGPSVLAFIRVRW
jgi:hypothetical protein